MFRLARVAPAALAAAGLVVLAGCHTPGGVVTRTIVVEFDTPNSAVAQKAVAAACGHLPGVSVDRLAAGDPNVLLDYSHADDEQFEALTSCVSTLQTSRPQLHIRDIQVQDGTDN